MKVPVLPFSTPLGDFTLTVTADPRAYRFPGHGTMRWQRRPVEVQFRVERYVRGEGERYWSVDLNSRYLPDGSWMFGKGAMTYTAKTRIKEAVEAALSSVTEAEWEALELMRQELTKEQVRNHLTEMRALIARLQESDLDLKGDDGDMIRRLHYHAQDAENIVHRYRTGRYV